MLRSCPTLTISFLCLAVWIFLAPLHASAQQSAQAEKASVGDVVPGYTFREFAGGDGRQELSEFRGQPVFVVNWTDTDFGRGASNKTEKVAKELDPKGLVLILLDTHNKSQDAIEASVMRLYPGNLSRLTRNQRLPIEYLDNGPPPDVALIGVDGRLLIAGSYTADFGKATKLAKAELKKLKTGWGEHLVARKVRAAAYGDKQLAKAKSMVDEALRAEPDHAELLRAQAEVVNRQRSWASSVGHLTEHGEYARALEYAQGLAAAVEGNVEWQEQAAKLLATFETPAARHELELERKLASLLKPLDKKKPSARVAAKLQGFADANSDTQVGLRAAHIAKIATLATEK
jgi:hypothetical protein